MGGFSTTVVVLLSLVLTACQPEERAWVLPEPTEVAAWFGSDTEVSLNGNLLEIRGVIDPSFLRRGGRLWARSGPYFYLFNVQVRDLLRDYPDLAGVRAIALTGDGRELARATLHRGTLSEIQWREALARASLAQTQGTESPRRVEELIHYGEDHTDHAYAD